MLYMEKAKFQFLKWTILALSLLYSLCLYTINGSAMSSKVAVRKRWWHHDVLLSLYMCRVGSFLCVPATDNLNSLETSGLDKR